jgi:hypothetical protein
LNVTMMVAMIWRINKKNRHWNQFSPAEHLNIVHIVCPQHHGLVL